MLCRNSSARQLSECSLFSSASQSSRIAYRTIMCDMGQSIFSEPGLSTPPKDPGLIRRGDVVMVWDPRSGRYYKRIFVVLSNEGFHANGRDEVQLVEIERPFYPFVATRLRLRRVGYKPSKLSAFEAGMRDLMDPGRFDDVANVLSRNATIIELPVEFSHGEAYKVRTTVVVSRPIAWTAHGLVFFCDISSGEALVSDWRLGHPTNVGLTSGSFVKARIWYADADQVRGYNRDRERPMRLHLDDMRGVTTYLDAGLQIGVEPLWGALRSY